MNGLMTQGFVQFRTPGAPLSRTSDIGSWILPHFHIIRGPWARASDIGKWILPDCVVGTNGALRLSGTVAALQRPKREKKVAAARAHSR